MKKLNKKGQAKGFTLTELVIVIVIIAILAAVLIPSMTGYVERARKSSNEQTAESIGTVFAAWLIDESDKLSYAAAGLVTYTDKASTVAGSAANYNTKLTNAITTADLTTEPTSGNYTTTYKAKEAFTPSYENATALTKDATIDETTYGKLTDDEKSQKVYEVYNYTEAYVVATNAKLEGAVKSGWTNFHAYYLEASENNTTTTEGIQNVTATSFEYKGSKYTTKAVYENGAFTYETTKNA